MLINFQPDDDALATALVQSTSRANGKWVGPVEATMNGRALVDVKHPIGAPRAVLRGRGNNLDTLTFGLHFIAADAAAAQALFAAHFIALRGKTGTLTLAAETYAGAVISESTLTNKGAYLRAQLSIQF